jgi:hypothetical protein
MNAMQYVLLILAGGTGVPTAVFLIARALVHRDTNAVFEASVVGELRVANAEAAARRPKETIR